MNKIGRSESIQVPYLDASVHNGNCQIIGPHVNKNLADHFQKKADKYQNLYSEKKASKKEHQATVLKASQSVHIGSIQITNEEIDVIKKAIIEITDELKKLKEKKHKAAENLSNVVEQMAFDAHQRKHHRGEALGHLHQGAISVVQGRIERFDELKEALKETVENAFDDLLHRKKPDASAQQGVPIVVSNAKNTTLLPGKTEYKNNGKYDLQKVQEATKDAVNNSTSMIKFLKDIFNIESFDNKGSKVASVIHYMRNYVNAFFNGKYMVYGDGNKYFDQFVKYLGIAAHEIWHAVTGGLLNYLNEAGALNESYSDIMGACCEMYTNNIAVKDFHWEVGRGLITYKGQTYPLRTFKAGPAYVNVAPIGTDPQPDDYTGVDTSKYPDDNGGVHIFSKLPNRVFYMTSMHYNDWKKPALFWKDVLDTINNPNITFAEFAAFQINKARNSGDEELAGVLEQAWDTVKVDYKAVPGIILANNNNASAPNEKNELIDAVAV